MAVNENKQDQPEVMDASETSIDIPKKKVLSVARETMDMEKLLEASKMLANSTIVPTMYQFRPENCYIALDMASRMGISPMVVMQNLHIINGKPSWSGQAIASLIRTTPKFENVQLHYVGEPNTDNWGAYVTAIDVYSGNQLKGSLVTIKMAKAEGWYQKTGSKWKTMPEQMLAYRAYSFFGRVYAPELTMGLHSVEEVEDISQSNSESQAVNPFERGEK